MKPNFALSLSFEGIQLLHRGAGGWRLVGEVALHEEDLTGELAKLRDAAVAIEPNGVHSKIIIPNDQIKYITIVHTPDGSETLDVAVAQALAGATPYAVEDLAFDVAQDGDVVHIAAVARETLSEAEAFALEHRFSPLYFAAIPGDAGFLGEPDFGPTLHAASALQSGQTLDPDGIAVVVVGTAQVPTEPRETANIEPTPEDMENASGPSFSSVRATRLTPTNVGMIAPNLGGASRETEAMPTLVKGAEIETLTVNGATAPAIDVQAGMDDGQERDPDRDTSPIDQSSEAFPDLSVNTDRFPSPRTPAILPAAPRDPGLQATQAVDPAFGAPLGAAPAGKPRYLGLILTAVLLVFLAAVAAWASIYLDDGLAGLFKGKKPETEIAVRPASPITAEEIANGLEETDTPLPLTDVTLTALDTEELSDADAAVLDALRQPAPIQELTQEQAQTHYATSGIWQMAPLAPNPAKVIDVDDLYIASIDAVTVVEDAIALPSAGSFLTDERPDPFTSPVASGTRFALGTDGRVVPTAQGALSPDGVMVFLGKPSVVPPPTPNRSQPPTEVETATLANLAKKRPKLRPANLVEQNERQQLGGLSRSELAGLRPRVRPLVEKVEEEKDEAPTKFAVVTSRKPNARPSDIDRIVQQANAQKPVITSLASVGAVASVETAPIKLTPSIPSSASVTKQATVKNAINLSKVNLIGVYGTPSSRRALVRMSNGRYKKVQVGDSIDGGKISAIGDNELRYVKSGRNVVLTMPKS
jgi:hypothetical protein